MLSLLVLSLLACLSLTKPNENVTQINAGMITSFKQSFFDDYRHALNDQLLFYLQSIGPLSVNYTPANDSNSSSLAFTDFNFTLAGFNSNDSAIKLQAKEPHLDINLSELNIECNFAYQAEGISQGRGQAWARNMTFDLKLSPYTAKGDLQVKVTSVDIKGTDIGVKLGDDQ